jgi:hypothetical protein
MDAKIHRLPSAALLNVDLYRDSSYCAQPHQLLGTALKGSLIMCLISAMSRNRLVIDWKNPEP